MLSRPSDAQEYIEEWEPISAESNLLTWMLGPMSSCKIYSSGVMLERTSQWKWQAAVPIANRARYWESKLAPGHVPSEAYVSYVLLADPFAEIPVVRLRTLSEQSTSQRDG